MLVFSVTRATRLAIAAVLSASALQTQALAAPRVSVALTECDGVPIEDVVQIVGIELRVSVTPASAALPVTTEVRANCADLSVVKFSVIDGVTGKTVSRNYDLSRTAPIARPRLVALTIAELVSAAWAELALEPSLDAVTEPATEDHVEDRRAALAVVEKRSKRAVEFSGAALGTVRAWGTEWLGYGGELSALGQLGAFGVVVNVGAQHGSVVGNLGTVALNVLDVRAGVLVKARLAQLAARFGFGGRGGVVWVRGVPRDRGAVRGGSGAAPYIGPVAFAALAVPLGDGFSAELGAESGYALTAVRANVTNEPQQGAKGLWLGGAAGVAVGF